MTTAGSQRPDLARELIARATESAAHRAKRLRNQLDAVQLGQGRHADHANTKVLRRILTEHAATARRVLRHGPDVLVAPVYEPGARARRVYLPSGARWFDPAIGRVVEGGTTLEADAPLERVPVFVREGAQVAALLG